MLDGLFLQFGLNALERIDVGWTFMLLMSRYIGLIFNLPGIGMGERGLYVRLPAVILLSVTSLVSSPTSPLPNDWFIAAALFICELMFGSMLGLLPRLIITGVQTGTQIATGTMGLSAANLIDPSTGGSMSDLARIHGDLITVTFLALGGHYVILLAASGLNQIAPPGTFRPDGMMLEILVKYTAHIFESAILVSAPIVVALLLTNFVMGMLSKVVPTLNLFIVSFPLTIGIGLLLSVVAIPDIMIYAQKELAEIDLTVGRITSHLEDLHRSSRN